MKELTTEQKAQRYDEALKIAMSWYVDAQIDFKKSLENLFPELKASDERVRKEIVSAINIYCSEYHRETKIREDMLAWLEKQGENNLIEEIKRRKELLLREKEKAVSSKDTLSLGGRIAMLEELLAFTKEKQGEQKSVIEMKSAEESLGIDSDTYNKIVDECIYDEQKPADKVEPKFNFKVGQWIVATGKCVYLIVQIDGFNITLIDTNGDKYVFDASSLDDAHEWTIQDAKDGDVLHSIGWDNDCIFIFNGLDRWKFDAPNGDKAVATGYCCLSVSADNMEFGIQGPDCIEVNTVKPANKIQHDLLFQKMKESGYEWNAEKKELKKIEKNPADIIPEDFEKYVEQLLSLSDGEGHGRPAKVKEVSLKLLKLAKIEQNPAWSEEDENLFEEIKRCVEIQYPLGNTKIFKFLKSLKPQKPLTNEEIE